MASLLHIVPYLGLGGTEKHVLDLARAFKAQHRVAVCAPPDRLLPAFEAEGVPVYTFPHLEEAPVAGVRQFTRAVRRAAAEQGADVVHVHAANELLLLARLLFPRQPLVFTVHGFFGPSARIDYFTASLVGRLCADRIICVSPADARRLAGLGVRRERIAVVPNGVSDPLERLQRTAARQREALKPEGSGAGSSSREEPRPVVVGTIARLERQKRVDLLLRAAAAVRRQGHPLRVVIVGDGSLRRSLEELAAREGLADAEFTGFLDEEAKDRILTSLDVFVLPSEAEAFPLVCLEAMAAGKPVLATAVGGVPDQVEDGVTGYLVPPGEVEALAGRLAVLVSDASLRARLGAAARRRYEERFTVEAMARGTWAAYEEVWKSRGKVVQ
ncbi:MAG: glycosyltransferase family 4 protein [Bacillota bacterium]|nr:glycosyltransferase family 4 protein [Bacillota bacterium]